VSWAKTRVQNLGSGHEATPITVNGEVAEAVSSFVYLGYTISSGSNSHSEVMRRIGLASSVIDRLSRIWLQRHLSLTTKCRLYSSCILAVLLYACKTWTLTKPDWKRLESFHLHCQRRILGIKWSDFITNAEVYTRSGLQSIQSIVRRRCLSLFGHVACMPDNVPAKAVLCMACDVRDRVPPFPNWRRPRSRPPITWLHQICSDSGLSAGDTLNCTQDRAVWRTYATTSWASC